MVVTPACLAFSSRNFLPASAVWSFLLGGALLLLGDDLRLELGQGRAHLLGRHLGLAARQGILDPLQDSPAAHLDPLAFEVAADLIAEAVADARRLVLKIEVLGGAGDAGLRGHQGYPDQGGDSHRSISPKVGGLMNADCGIGRRMLAEGWGAGIRKWAARGRPKVGQAKPGALPRPWPLPATAGRCRPRRRDPVRGRSRRRTARRCSGWSSPGATACTGRHPRPDPRPPAPRSCRWC